MTGTDNWEGDAALNCVITGHGFDLSAREVLDLCREGGPLKDLDTATVRPDRKRLGQAIRPRVLIECIVVPTKFFSGN